MLKTTNTTDDVTAAILRILAMDADTRKKSLKFEIVQTPANDDTKRRTMANFFDNGPSVTEKTSFTAPFMAANISFTATATARDNGTQITSKGKPAGRFYDFRNNLTTTTMPQIVHTAPTPSLVSPTAILSGAFADTAAPPLTSLATKYLTVQQTPTDRPPIPSPASSRKVLPFIRRPTLS